ncbi:MAG: HEAT repeat domain-containing protein, partial [Calditrichaceae bacterium]
AFAEMRSRVLRVIKYRVKNRNESLHRKILPFLLTPFRNPALAASIAAILFLTGFVGGKFMHKNSFNDENGLIRQINFTAEQNRKISQIENSPYIFSNVNFAEIDKNNIALSFDVTTHLEMNRSKSDPVVKEVLTQALLNPESVGNRLKSISLAEEVLDPKIKEALISTMINDPNLGVRQKAMQALAGIPNDERIKDVFLSLLKNEESTNMRLMAIDYLTTSKTSDYMLEKAIQGMEPGKDAAVIYKVNKYLNQ